MEIKNDGDKTTITLSTAEVFCCGLNRIREVLSESIREAEENKTTFLEKRRVRDLLDQIDGCE